MKQMMLLLFALLFSEGIINASCGIFEPEVNKKEEPVSFLSEKESKIDEDSFWEKVSDKLEDKSLLSDDDKKLYAPPPGEEGNPQKIVTPLGRGEVLAFLVLSFLWIVYIFRKINKKIII